MGFKVLIHHRAKRRITKYEKETRERLERVFDLLAEPFKLDTVKLRGEEGTYRTRIGKYRVLFALMGNTVYITDFDTRGKVYKQR